MLQKTAIVTGASSGIGLGIAKTLLAKNYRVVAGSRKLTAANALKKSEQCFLVDGDVGDKATGEKLAEVAMNKTGRIDLLVNNAGIFVPGNFLEYSEEQYRSIIATNADGFFYVTQPVVRHMVNQRQGHVVSISTTLASQPVAGVNAFGTYFSKGAINAATKSLANKVAPRALRLSPRQDRGVLRRRKTKPARFAQSKAANPILPVPRARGISKLNMRVRAFVLTQSGQALSTLQCTSRKTMIF